MAKKKQRTKGNETVWNDGMYLKAYLLAKDGLSDEQIGRALGYGKNTMSNQMKARPFLKEAVETARKETPRAQRFFEYIYEHLPPRLQNLWNQIEAVEKSPSAYIRVKKMMENKNDRFRQHLFLHAFVTRNFNASAALKSIGLSYSRLRRWMQVDPDFVELMDEMLFHKKNFVESALMKLVSDGDNAAVIFANKTLNRDRGYSERQDIHVEHEHTHKHVIDLESLNLSLDIKKAILLAIREKEAAPLRLTDQRDPEDGVVDAEYEIKKLESA
jgi:hypothetical protein